MNKNTIIMLCVRKIKRNKNPWNNECIYFCSKTSEMPLRKQRGLNQASKSTILGVRLPRNAIFYGSCKVDSATLFFFIKMLRTRNTFKYL